MTNLINCGTCGYPLTPEERTTLIEKDGVMVKPARGWADLTAEEIVEVMSANPELTVGGLLAVQKKLREKNT